MTAFVPLVVPSADGPHVTPTAGVEAFGRYWTTTSRRAFKARSIRRHRVAGYTVSDGGRTTILTGRAVVIDPLRPWQSLPDVGAATVAPLAVGRIGLSHVRQVLGYLETAGDVLPGWSIVDRVLVAVAPKSEIVVTSRDLLPWGVLEGPTVTEVIGRAGAGGDGDGRDGDGRDGAGRMPGRVRELVIAVSAAPVPCVVGLESPDGPLAVPARWDGTGFALPVDVVERVPTGARWSAMFHRSDDRRPDQKFGFFVRGPVLDARDGPVGLAVRRLTWWDGFRSGTITATRDPVVGDQAA